MVPRTFGYRKNSLNRVVLYIFHTKMVPSSEGDAAVGQSASECTCARQTEVVRASRKMGMESSVSICPLPRTSTYLYNCATNYIEYVLHNPKASDNLLDEA